MKKEAKKNLIKILKVAAFLALSIIIVLPYLIQFSVYFHEKAHLDVFERYSVNAVYKADFKTTIYNFYFGDVGNLGHVDYDETQYNRLGKYQKAEINLAGLISDIEFLIIIVILICLVNISAFWRIANNKKVNLSLILALNWLLFIWFLALIKIIILNLVDFSGDLFQLIKYLK